MLVCKRFYSLLSFYLYRQKEFLILLMGGKKKLAQPRYVFVDSPQGPAVINEQHWKLRYNKQLKKFRLHYLPKDYREEKILNDRYPEILEHLKKKLEPYL